MEFLRLKFRLFVIQFFEEADIKIKDLEERSSQNEEISERLRQEAFEKDSHILILEESIKVQYFHFVT